MIFLAELAFKSDRLLVIQFSRPTALPSKKSSRLDFHISEVSTRGIYPTIVELYNHLRLSQFG